MADTRYVVEVDVKVFDADLKRHEDHLSRHSAHAKGLEKSYRDLKSGIADLARSASGTLVGALDAVARKTIDVAKFMTVAGGGAAAAGIVYGVTRLNAELETTKTSLGAVFGTQGFAANVPHGLELASDVIKHMRKDAQQLPGEFEDLLRIFQTGSVPAFKSGLDIQGWEKLSAKVMATAKATSVPMDQAAREFAMLMEGRSGAHNVFGMRLLGLSGESAEKFNKSSADERLKKLTVELDKYGKYIEAFGKTWDAVWSTSIDHAKNFVRTATAPLFEKAKGALDSINKWLDANPEKVEYWANYIGTHLANAFDWGKKKIEEWWPVIKTFATNAWERMKEIWVQMKPHIDAAGDSIKKFLQDPKAIDKIITALKLYLAIKVADKGVSAGGSLLGVLGPGMQLLSGMGVGGGAAAGAGAAGAAGAGGAAAGGMGFGAFLGAAGTTLPLAAGISGTWAQIEGFKLVAESTELVVSSYRREHQNAVNDVRRFTETLDRVADENIVIQGKFAELTAQGDDTRIALLEVALAAREAAKDLASINRDKQSGEIAERALQSGFQAQSAFVKGEIQKQQQLEKQGKKHKGGGGGTSIQKVEIVVTSNQDPSRIAREVWREAAKLGANRRSSPFVRNFSIP